MLPEPKFLNLETLYSKILNALDAIFRFIISIVNAITGITNIKIIVYSITFVFAGSIVYYVIMLHKLKKLRVKDVVDDILLGDGVVPESKSKRWEEIKTHIQSDIPAQWKVAIIEADSLLDDILAHAGYDGESLGERLKKIEASDLQSLQDVWDAHKVRNRIAHDANYELTKPAAEATIERFEKALKELKFL